MGLTLGVLHEALSTYHDVTKQYRRQVAYCELGPLVYFDIGTHRGTEGRVVVELQQQAQPELSEHLLKLCAGQYSDTGAKPRTYANAKIAAIDKPSRVLLVGNTEDGEPTFHPAHVGGVVVENARQTGPCFQDGSLVMLPFSWSSRHFSSLFYFYTGSATWVRDGVVVGRIVEGKEVVEELMDYGTDSGIPRHPLYILACGRL
ncbi:unnamed protein product, partial [Mesorhabditis spiculigera]